MLTVTNHKLEIFSPAPMKIVQIADLHKRIFGKNNEKLVQKIAKIKPDYIFLCGDMITRDCEDFRGLGDLLGALVKICPVFYAPGNHELEISEKFRWAFYKTVTENGVFYLENSTLIPDVLDRKVCIAGLTLRKENYRVNGKYDALEPYTAADINAALGQKKNFTILIAHNPLFMDVYADWGADLVLSGHVHGGVVRLPFLGGLLSPERKFFPKYSAGIYREGGTVMSVTRGLGKFRLFNPPEIVVLEIFPKNR